MASGVRKTLGGSDKDEKDEKKGGFLSFWRGGEKDDKDKDEGGLFSFGDDKKKDDDKGGIFSKIFDKDDDNDKPKKSGFQGLFSEQEGASGGEATPTPEDVGDVEGRGAGVSDGGTYRQVGGLMSSQRTFPSDLLTNVNVFFFRCFQRFDGRCR